MSVLVQRAQPAAPAAAPPPARKRLTPGRYAVYVVLLLLAIFAIGPMLIFGFNALKTQSELAGDPLGLPANPQWGNFVDAWQQANMGVGLRNSVLIVAATALGVCVIAGCAAYALGRLRVPGSNFFIIYLLVTSALPIQLFLVPLFFMWTNLGLYDNLFGLVIIYWAIYSPFATLLIRSFMVGVPREYEEAARLDGAGSIRVLTKVIMPLAWPGFLTAALVAGLSAYNEFLLAVTFIQSSDKMPVSTSFFSFQAGYTRDYTLVSAGGMIMVIPVLVLFLLLQRRFIDGYSSSGMTG
ncbi:carbohydrate ABC transporter permease [Jiangella alkaliphila]|uniref:Carbohydrate ABC transporter membrane protein 2, CUT1 family n=1 Tax=Jiangella alkaliphila TaxID=419479 RepID=A0A1H2LD58_9ACTN|nr:carbohydrate ABC transporter permease [Jiangella alkaliphila]SDU78970.1 carbohydrate ABC transporter membrane protein 2, CUT1 family [Jiangella alkaliphila]